MRTDEFEALFNAMAEDAESDDPVLGHRQRIVLRRRFGAQPHTLAEVALEFGVSRERVRQLENDAMRALGLS